MLRANTIIRERWYKRMREAGAPYISDTLALEDMPAVAGGDERYASLNYVPLKDWAKLSSLRAARESGGDK